MPKRKDIDTHDTKQSSPKKVKTVKQVRVNICPLVNGVKHGLEQRYDSNGTLIYRCCWNNGTKDGLEEGFEYPDYVIQWVQGQPDLTDSGTRAAIQDRVHQLSLEYSNELKLNLAAKQLVTMGKIAPGATITETNAVLNTLSEKEYIEAFSLLGLLFKDLDARCIVYHNTSTGTDLALEVWQKNRVTYMEGGHHCIEIMLTRALNLSSPYIVVVDYLNKIIHTDFAYIGSQLYDLACEDDLFDGFGVEVWDPTSSQFPESLAKRITAI